MLSAMLKYLDDITDAVKASFPTAKIHSSNGGRTQFINFPAQVALRVTYELVDEGIRIGVVAFPSNMPAQRIPMAKAQVFDSTVEDSKIIRTVVNAIHAEIAKFEASLT